MSMAPKLSVAPPLPVCPGCGAQRAVEDESCPRCALARPIAGWTTQPPVGDEMPGLEGFRLGAPLRPHGPVLRSRVAGPPPRPGGPPLAAIALQVSEPGLFPTMRARSRALQGTAHPAVPAVASAGTFHGRPTRIEQHVPGETVRALTWRRGPMAVEEVLAIVTEVAQALDVLHRAGVIHGRVCPDAVLLRSSRGDGPRRPLLIEIPAVPAGPWLGGVAPELRLGDEPGPRTDLFGLGYLLVTMLNGDDPGADGRDKAWARTDAGPVLSLRDRPDVPAGLGRLVTKLVQREPAHRPDSLEAVIAALRAVGSGGRGTAQPPVPAAPGPEPRSGLPTWWPAAALIAGVVLLFAGAGLLSTVTGVAELLRPGESPPAPPQHAPATGRVDAPPTAAPPPAPTQDEQGLEAAAAPEDAPQPVPDAARPDPAPAPPPAEASTAPEATPAPSPSTEPPARSAARSSRSAPPPPAPEAPPEPAPEPAPPEATEPQPPPEAEAEAEVEVESAGPEPAAEADDPPPEAPLSVAGRWTGTALGYPAVMDLREEGQGTVRGSVSLRVGSRTVRYTVSGLVARDGSLQLSQSGGGSRASWTGRATSASLSGVVSPAPRDSGTFALTR